MISLHFHLGLSYRQVKRLVGTTEDAGTSVAGLARFFRLHGLKVSRPATRLHELERALARGALVVAHTDGDHYVVVHALDGRHAWVSDPSLGRQIGHRISRRRFRRRWNRWGLAVRK